MKTYPIESMDLERAMRCQFKMVDCITRTFGGMESLTRGDLGVVPGLGKPVTTQKAENVIAHYFGTENSVLVRGSGTGAIRSALHAVLRSGETLLVHTAPIYPTTEVTIDMMGLKLIRADFNDLDAVKKAVQENPEIKAALVQYTRQSIKDQYDLEAVIDAIKSTRSMPVVTDDNYAVMKAEKNGTQCGADLACFSTFKLLGPEGIGCVVGAAPYVEKIIERQYSGGSQTQGWEALEVLRGLVYAPVSLAIQAQVNEALVRRITQGEVSGIRDAFLANAQSKVLLVEFEKPIAKQVLQAAMGLGALGNPVGAESKYEMAPLFYRVSGTFLKEDPTLIDRMIRINPNRSGADTVIRILKEAIEKI